MDAFRTTPRTRVRRAPARGAYDRETVYAILDAGLICHVGYVIDGQPYVTPTSYWREGEQVYWHGSSASQMLRHLTQGVPVCFTVTHLDGLVLARSGFHHSINYRSVMAFGTAELVPEREKLEALDRFVDHVLPGRNADIRRPTKQEVKATTVLRMTLDEVSAKVRTGAPVDDEEDYALPCWAGVVPLATHVGTPEPDPRLVHDAAPPDYIAALARFGWRVKEPSKNEASDAAA